LSRQCFDFLLGSYTHTHTHTHKAISKEILWISYLYIILSHPISKDAVKHSKLLQIYEFV